MALFTRPPLPTQRRPPPRTEAPGPAGSASFALDAPAVGAWLFDAAGSASIAFIASGASEGLQPGTGSASIDVAAPGVGASLHEAVGSASLSLSATAPGVGLHDGAGSASLSLSAAGVAPFGAGSAAVTLAATGVGSWLHAAAGAATVTLEAAATSTSWFPLTVDASGRYLNSADGQPFLICADSTWETGVNIPGSGINAFLDDMTAKGFNALMTNTIEHHYSVVKPPKNIDGVLPFTQRMDGAAYTGSPNGTTAVSGTQGQFAADAYGNINTQAPDPTFFNSTYWARMDTLISACLVRNMVVFVWPMYLGFHGNQEGWISELTVWDSVIGAGGFTGQSFANATKSKLFNYGAGLAARWSIYPNIIWVAGGDYGSGSQTLSAAQSAAVKSCIDGIKSVSGLSTLWTAHWDRPCISDDTAISGVTWDLNFAYSGEDSAEVARRAYSAAPTKPAFFGEGYYEGSPFGGVAPFRQYL